jgi:hypothetical protein
MRSGLAQTGTSLKSESDPRQPSIRFRKSCLWRWATSTPSGRCPRRRPATTSPRHSRRGAYGLMQLVQTRGIYFGQGRQPDRPLRTAPETERAANVRGGDSHVGGDRGHAQASSSTVGTRQWPGGVVAAGARQPVRRPVAQPSQDHNRMVSEPDAMVGESTASGASRKSARGRNGSPFPSRLLYPRPWWKRPGSA